MSAERTAAPGPWLGTLDEIPFDAETDPPEWAEVKTGVNGLHLSFTPLPGQLGRRAGPRGLEKAQIKDAPTLMPRQLAAEDEGRLYRRYGVSYSGRSGEGAPPAGPRAEQLL